MHIFTKKITKSIYFLLAFFCLSSSVFAQVPVNDEPCNAIVLTPTASCNYVTYTNVDASNSATVGIPDPTPFLTCGIYTDADVWFKVTVPAGATSTVIDTRNIGMADGGMTVYTATGVCPNLTMTQVLCTDDGSINPGMPSLTLTNPAGTVLYIRMYGNGGETGTFGICVTANIPPPNDDCVNAISLTVNPDYNCGVVSTGNTTINATQSTGAIAPACSATGINDDVWFSFVATNTSHRLSLLNVSPVANTLSTQLYSGTCAALSRINCTTTNQTDFTGLIVGNTYFLRIFTTSATSTVRATFDVCLGTLPPPPANDECAGAVNLTVNSTLTCTSITPGTTQSATASTGTPILTCGNSGENDDVWFSFTATSTSHRISLSSIVPAATGMVTVAYSGASCAALTEVGCGTTSPLQINGLTIGNVYYVRVFTGSSLASTVANFSICVATPPPPPANDECSGAIALTVNTDFLCGVTTAGTTLSATPSTSLPVPSCGVANAFNDDVWYSFIATNARHRITLSAITGYSGTMVTQVLSGACGALTQVVCNTTNSFDVNALTVGNTYFVRVFTNTASITTEVTSFNLCIGSPPPAPINDDCINANTINVNPTLTCSAFTQATITSATASGTLPVPSCAPAGVDDDVWFKFVATNNVHQISISNILPVTTMAIAVYSGTCAGLTEITCNQTNLFNVLGLTVGNTYYVRVYSSGTVANLEVDFRICVATPPPPPVNDDCAGATTLTVNPNLTCVSFGTGTTQSALQSTTLPIPSCAPANSWNDDVWFSFVAAAPVERITLYNATGTTDLITTVYSGTCAALTEIACSDPDVFNVAGLTIGNTYYVRVFTKSTSLTVVATSFNICVANLPAPPPNDNCSGAIPLTINTNLTCAVSLPGTTVGATLSTTMPTPSCAVNNSWNDDVWYSFVATSTSHRVSLLNITGLTTAMVTTVYSGTCGTLSQVVCNTANSFDAQNLVIGNTYYVRVLTANATPEDASFSICIGSPAPNTTCNTAIPFCNQITNEVNFGSTQGINSSTGISCLGTTPNQNWFDIVVETAGPIFIEISQTGGNVSNDVDFAAWGPFTSPAAACAAIPAQATIVNIPAGVPTAASTQGGCSYSAAPIEYFKIPNALPGQVYKLLVTNFSSSNNNLPPFTTPSQFVRLRSMIPVASGGASLDCNLTCFSATATNTGPVCPGGTFNLAATGSLTPFSWTGPAGFTSSAQNITGLVASTTPGNYVYTVTVGTGTTACVKSTTVVVTAPPVAPVVPATPIVYCQDATASVLTATALPGNTLQWYLTATGGVPTTTLTPFTTAAYIGSTMYYVSQKAGSCEGPRAAITVNVIAKPVLPDVSTSDAFYCQNETAVALTATATTGNTLLYYTAATGGTGVASIIPLTTNAGTFTYYVTQTTPATAGSCQSLRAPIVVTIKPRPAPPTPTIITPAYCQGASTSALAATGLVTGANLLWYTTLTGLPAGVSTVTPSNTASSTYYVTQTLNGCESTPRVPLTTTITPTPLAPVVAAVGPLYCQGATGATALTATALPGNTLLWYTTATLGTGTTTLIPNTASTNTYYVSQQTANNCEGPRTPLIVTITATPALPAVSATAVVYCQNDVAIPLTATASAGNSLLYYTAAIGGTGLTTYTPPTNIDGTFTYYVSQQTTATLGACEGPRAAIVVTVKPRPAPPTPTIITPAYCQGASTSALAATGLVTGANLLWYTTLTGLPAGVSTVTPSNTASSTYYVTQTLNGCESTPRVPLTTTITPTPLAPVVAAVGPLYCQGATGAALLTAIALPGNTLLWYTTATLGTGTTTLIPNTASTNTYYVSQQTANNCEGPRTPLVVTITATPALPLVSATAVVYCQNDVAIPLTATASVGNSLLYYTAITGGTGLTTYTPPTNIDGTFTYYVSQQTTATLGACEGPRAAIVVIVKPRPAPPTPTIVPAYCQGVSTLPLTATGLVSGANLLWYANLTGGASIATPTPSNAANSTFYVTQILNGCESTPRVPLTTTITPTPLKPVVVTPVKYCPGDPASPLSTAATAFPGNTLLYYTTAIGGTGTATPIIPATNIPGNFNFYVSQVTAVAIGGCEGPRALITVSVSNNNLLVYIGKDTTICEGGSASFMPTVTPNANIYAWSVKTLGIAANTISNNAVKDVSLSPIDTAEYVLRATLGGCFVEDTVKVNVIWKPKITTKGNFAICNNTSTTLQGIISHNSSNDIDYLWTPNDSLASPDKILTIAKPTFSTKYTITYKTQAAYGCSFTDSTSMKLVIQPIVKAFAGNDTIAATNLQHQLRGTGGLNYTWSSNTGLSITNATSQIAYVNLNKDANIQLKVTDAIGCVGYDEIFIKVLDGPTYHSPNAFTPNGDGLNDIFRVVPAGITNTVYFRVINRWGQVLFETNQWLKGWDGTFMGKPQASGVYVWMVKGKDKFNKIVELQGTVNLIR
jgi:gliding motility-associated-like protein